MLSYNAIKTECYRREAAGIHDWHESIRITLLAMLDPIVSGGGELEDPAASSDLADITDWIAALP